MAAPLQVSKRRRLSHEVFADAVLSSGCSINKLLRANIAKILDVSSDTQSHMKNLINKELHRPGKIFTLYGTLIDKLELQLKSGSTTTIEYISPFALLRYTTHLSQQFGEFLAAEIPASGGRTAIYADEVYPTDGLRVEQNREYNAIYWTFIDFPTWYISREAGWPAGPT